MVTETAPKPRKRRAPRKAGVAPKPPSVTTTQAQLDAHERECAARYSSVLDKLGTLDKRMFRMEALHMASILAVVGLLLATLVK
jgi:hypothetical protein